MKDQNHLTDVLIQAKPYEIFEALVSVGKENLEKLIALNTLLTATIKIINRHKTIIKIK